MLRRPAKSPSPLAIIREETTFVRVACGEADAREAVTRPAALPWSRRGFEVGCIAGFITGSVAVGTPLAGLLSSCSRLLVDCFSSNLSLREFWTD